MTFNGQKKLRARAPWSYAAVGHVVMLIYFLALVKSLGVRIAIDDGVNELVTATRPDADAGYVEFGGTTEDDLCCVVNGLPLGCC